MYHGQELIIHHGHTPWSHRYRHLLAVKNHAWYHGQDLAGEGGEERKRNGCTPIVYKIIWRLVLAEQKLLDAKDPFGGNVLKNPARYIFHCYGCTLRIVYDYANPLTAIFSQGCLQAGSIFGQK